MSFPVRMRSSAPSPSPPPSLIRCPELDLSVTLSSAHSERPRPSGQPARSRDTLCIDGPAVVTQTDPQHPTSNRRTNSCHGGDFEPPVSADGHRGNLEGAELNTTLALKAELQALQETEFNSQKAVCEALQKSARTKNLINNRATEGVNLARSQPLFTSLVSIDVQVDQIIRQATQDRLLLAPPPCCRDNQAAAGSPSPLLFMTRHLLRQKPLQSERELNGNKPRPPSHAVRSTFDLHERQTCWEL